MVLPYEPSLFNVLHGFDCAAITMMKRDDEVTTQSIAIICSPIWHSVPIFNMEDMPSVYLWYNNIPEHFSSHTITDPIAVLRVHHRVVSGSP